MGLSTIIPTVEMEFKQFIKRADQALYMAKIKGRNQWQIWDQSLADEYEKLMLVSVVSSSDIPSDYKI
jgi:predicted signal transduction protein with EAL and GGDEF domain